MGRVRRGLLAAVIVGLVSSVSPTLAGAEASYTNFEADGWVTNADVAPPTRSGFVLDDEPNGPGQLTATGGADAARNPSDGSLTIRVTATTKFWKWNDSTSAYEPLSYERVVVLGAHLHVGGRYSLVEGAWVLFANFVWSPPPPASPPSPSNPAPSAPHDFTFARTFAVLGAVTETGRTILANQFWSRDFGFVLGSINELGHNEHVERIAAAHSDRLAIHSNAFTNFYAQDPVTGQYRRSTKEEMAQMGAQLLVAGRYAWINFDWMFVANYVWRPSPAGLSSGLIHFDLEAPRQSSGTPTATGGWQASAYRGTSTVSHTSNNDVNPGPVTFDLSWEPESSGVRWFFSGEWSATKQGTTDGVRGTLSGYWSPTSGEISGATAIITQGSGLHCNVSGSGPFTGFGLIDPTGGATQSPPSALDGSLKLTAIRDSTVTC